MQTVIDQEKGICRMLNRKEPSALKTLAEMCFAHAGMGISKGDFRKKGRSLNRPFRLIGYCYPAEAKAEFALASAAL